MMLETFKGYKFREGEKVIVFDKARGRLTEGVIVNRDHRFPWWSCENYIIEYLVMFPGNRARWVREEYISHYFDLQKDG